MSLDEGGGQRPLPAQNPQACPGWPGLAGEPATPVNRSHTTQLALAASKPRCGAAFKANTLGCAGEYATPGGRRQELDALGEMRPEARATVFKARRFARDVETVPAGHRARPFLAGAAGEVLRTSHNGLLPPSAAVARRARLVRHRSTSFRALRVCGNPRYVLRPLRACRAASWVQLAALEGISMCGHGFAIAAGAHGQAPQAARSSSWPPPARHPPPKGAPWLSPLSCPA